MQTVQKINLRKQRDFSQKLNATFAFLRQNIKPLGKCMLHISGPFLLIAAISYGMLQASVVHVIGGIGAAFAQHFTISLLLMALSCLLFTFIAVAAMIGVTNHYMKLYMTVDDLNITPAMVWNKVKKDMAMLVLTSIGTTIIVIIGTVFLLVPGIYLGVGLSFVFAIRIFEGGSFMDSVRRSLNLVAGKWWSTLGLMFVITIIAGAIGFVFSLPETIITVVAQLHSATNALPGEASYLTPLSFVTGLVSFFCKYFVYALYFIATAFQYFNLVERKEAVGLLQQIEMLGTPKPSADDKEDY
jgi:hypothetical protein